MKKSYTWLKKKKVDKIIKQECTTYEARAF